MTPDRPGPGPPPAAPGALGQPPEAREVLDYLASMTGWTARLRASLDEVDARARLGGPDLVLTADITLAYALGQAITTRVGEISGAWDSGRVGRAELERISQLLWSRLDDGPGGLPVSLTEACVLGEALLMRLTQRLEHDPARSSAALQARAVREALARCRRHAELLGRPESAVLARRIEADLDQALTTGGGTGTSALPRIDAAASALERELILAGAARASLERERQVLATRLQAALARASDVRRLAARCAADVSRPPVLAVPDPTRLGAVPVDEPDPVVARAAVDAFAGRLDRVEAALRAAAERFAAPVAELAELQGLFDAYRAKATALGLTDPDLAEAHAGARAALASRPCDLDRAREQVGSYRRTVDSGKDARTSREPATVDREGRQR